ncbi:hypothetical protein L1887_03618 [Cichorium endivia]|nr:hypothetical protein L1887_03618 [Cichorium endivia]
MANQSFNLPLPSYIAIAMRKKDTGDGRDVRDTSNSKPSKPPSVASSPNHLIFLSYHTLLRYHVSLFSIIIHCTITFFSSETPRGIHHSCSLSPKLARKSCRYGFF